MESPQGKYRGIVGTILFHVSLLLVLYLTGFSIPLPLPQEEGILVNFGNSHQGKGNQEPAPKKINKAIRPPARPVSKPKKATKPKKSSEAKEKIITQDHEDAPSVPSAKKIALKKRKKEELQKKEQERKENARILEQKRQQKELLEKQRQREEQERLAKIEKERQEQQERERKIAAINNKAKNIFGKGSQNSTSKSQGKTFPGGNQGAPTGAANSNNYSGTGLGSKGISYSLNGRTSLSIPKPDYNYQEGGKVVVEVTVDRNGKVVNARAGMPGSTTSNAHLYNAAKKAALKASFNDAPKAPAYQKGTITYNFLLD